MCLSTLILRVTETTGRSDTSAIVVWTFLFFQTTIDTWTPLPARPRAACLGPAKSPPCTVSLRAACKQARQTCSSRQSHTGPSYTNIMCSSTFLSCFPSSPLAFPSRSSLLRRLFSRNHLTPSLARTDRHSTIVLFTMPAFSRIVSIPLRIGELDFGAVSRIHHDIWTPTYVSPGCHGCHRFLLQRPERGKSPISVHLHHGRCGNLHPSRSYVAPAILWELLPLAC